MRSQLYLISAVTIFLCWSAYRYYVGYARQRQALKALVKQYGCLPPPEVPTHRPWGLDRVEELFRSDIEGRLMEAFTLHFRQTGYTLKKKLIGFKSMDTAEPANIEAILSSNFKDWSFGARAKITEPMFGNGIFTQEGPAWKHSREILRPQFHHRQYADLDVFRESVEDLLDAISRDGKVVDLQPLFFRLTLDTTTAFLFGESVQSLKPRSKDNENLFANAFNTAQEYIVRRMRLMDVYWIVGGQSFTRACDDVHYFADRIIERNLAIGSKGGEEERKKYTFLNTLLENKLERTAIRGQVINVLVAGRDTTACLLSWTFFLLARHPQILTDLRKEISSIFNNTAPRDRDALRSAKYLQNVLKETLRLYPPIPVNIRVASKNTVLPTGGGPDRTSPVLVPKGTAVGFSTYTLQRRPDLYGMDAELFRPERWDEPMPMMQNETWSRWGYIPFHGGPRVCLGMDFALTEAAYTVVRILQRFNSIQLPTGVPMEIVGSEKQTMTLVLSIRDGCKLSLQ